jgi:hypothetical protein
LYHVPEGWTSYPNKKPDFISSQANNAKESSPPFDGFAFLGCILHPALTCFSPKLAEKTGAVACSAAVSYWTTYGRVLSFKVLQVPYLLPDSRYGENPDFCAWKSNYLAGNKTFQRGLRSSGVEQNILPGIKNFQPEIKTFCEGLRFFVPEQNFS